MTYFPNDSPTSHTRHLLYVQASVAYVSEYSRDSEVSRGRSKFFHGKTDLMLYSGRAHFFRLVDADVVRWSVVCSDVCRSAVV